MTIKFQVYKIISKLANFAGYNFSFTRRSNNFEGIYKSYKDALDSLENKYNYVSKHFQSNRKLLDIDYIEVSDHENIIPSFYCSKNDKNQINFLDIGGGINPIFQHIKKSSDLSFNCQILEHKDFKIAIPDEFRKNVVYKNNIEEINFNNLDFACFASSIQYIEDFDKILKQIFFNNIKHVFILKTFFTNTIEHKYVIQTNILKSKFPVAFFSMDKFDKIFLDNGYKKIFFAKRNNIKFENGVKKIKYTHNKLKPNDFYQADIIYEKN